MTRQLIYLAHPVAPTEEEIATVVALHGGHGRITPSPLRIHQAVEANVQAAMKWLAWLRKSFPEATFIAPWIAAILSGEDDGDPKAREAGLVDDCAVVERCDGIVLCGPRISSGMARERDHGIARGWITLERDPAAGAERVLPVRPRVFDVYDLTCPSNPDPPLTVGPMLMTLDELADVARDLWRR